MGDLTTDTRPRTVKRRLHAASTLLSALVLIAGMALSVIAAGTLVTSFEADDEPDDVATLSAAAPEAPVGQVAPQPPHFEIGPAHPAPTPPQRQSAEELKLDPRTASLRVPPIMAERPKVPPKPPELQRWLSSI